MIEQRDPCAQGQMSQGRAVENCLALERLASLRRGGRRRPPLHKRKPPLSERGPGFLIGLEEDLQTQLHVESFSGPDAGGAVEVADGVSDRAAAGTCGA